MLLRPPRLLPTRSLTSNTAIGTAFEQATLAFLSHPPLSLTLLRVGGANDRGIDLRGWWWDTRAGEGDTTTTRKDKGERRRKRWSVVVQCKAERKKIGPSVVRELEGVLAFEAKVPVLKGTGVQELVEAAAAERKAPSRTIGMLVSTAGFTKEALIRAAASTHPLSLVHLSSTRCSPDQANDKDVAAPGTTIGAERPAYSCLALIINVTLRELLGPNHEVVQRRNMKSGEREIEIRFPEVEVA